MSFLFDGCNSIRFDSDAPFKSASSTPPAKTNLRLIERYPLTGELWFALFARVTCRFRFVSHLQDDTEVSTEVSRALPVCRSSSVELIVSSRACNVSFLFHPCR